MLRSFVMTAIPSPTKSLTQFHLLGDLFETKSEIANSELCRPTFGLLINRVTVPLTMSWRPETYFTFSSSALLATEFLGSMT
jgi:hypothetical protein